MSEGHISNSHENQLGMATNAAVQLKMFPISNLHQAKSAFGLADLQEIHSEKTGINWYNNVVKVVLTFATPIKCLIY